MYLTKELKKYYLEALSEVENSDNEFWKLDEGIKIHLDVINKNERIQTLYSKSGKYLGGYQNESYLVFTYSKVVELKLFKEIIPYFMYNYNERYESICYYAFNEPYIREDKNEKGGILNLKCINDAQYFNINHIRITLQDGTKSINDRFWDDLSDKLSNIKL